MGISTATDTPWHRQRRSRLWAREQEIRLLRAEGWSLGQIICRLDLGVGRPTLLRWLRRADAALAAEQDRDAMSLLDSFGFRPPTRR